MGLACPLALARHLPTHAKGSIFVAGFQDNVGAGLVNAGDTVAVQCESPLLGIVTVSVRIAAIEVSSLNGS